MVEGHLRRFRDPLEASEDAMLARLRAISNGKLSPEGADLRFYIHELRELERYTIAGYPTGQPADPDEAYQLWDNAHAAILADFGLPEIDEFGNRVLYHDSLQHLLR